MQYLSRTPNKELMAQARGSLKGSWGLSIGVLIVYYLTVMVSNIRKAGPFIFWITAGPMALGFCMFWLALSRKQDPPFSKLFEGFNKFGKALGAFLLQTLFVCLWSLLLIVPGLIAGYAYSMTFYIIADNDAIGPLEAIRKSKEMMRGNKWKLFCLGFRFIGWTLLCVLTLGIGFLWLGPYVAMSYAKFYDDLKAQEAP